MIIKILSKSGEIKSQKNDIFIIDSMIDGLKKSVFADFYLPFIHATSKKKKSLLLRLDSYLRHPFTFLFSWSHANKLK